MDEDGGGEGGGGECGKRGRSTGGLSGGSLEETGSWAMSLLTGGRARPEARGSEARRGRPAGVRESPRGASETRAAAGRGRRGGSEKRGGPCEAGDLRGRPSPHCVTEGVNALLSTGI